MPRCPRLLPSGRKTASKSDSIVLAVYAPFGADDTLSLYPGNSQALLQHPLLVHLRQVAATGVHVQALVDRVNQDTVLVEIPAFKPAQVRLTSAWKQDMAHWRTLAGFLRRVVALHPRSALVLALEGHGAGYLPELDLRYLTTANVTSPENGLGAPGSEDGIAWQTTPEGSAPMLPTGAPVLPTGAPVLPTGAPVLPTGAPVLPAGPLPMSTWSLGQALRATAKACGVRPAVLHFNNCFNMSVELLHTVAPWAEYAAGYINYNYFSAGETYPMVFQKVAAAGGATAEQLALWFAQANGALFAPRPDHPSVGAAVRLSRMKKVADAVDQLADALLADLRNASNRAQEVGQIRQAAVAAQKLDTVPGVELKSPDQMTDLRSLAAALLKQAFELPEVHAAAKAVLAATEKIKVYGSKGTPWIDPTGTVQWDFSADTLAMNIYLPDPGLDGVWDWRSPYYLDVNPGPVGRLIQPHVIDFLTQTNWAEFIIEYHQGVPFNGLLPALAPVYPVYLGRDGKPPQNPGDNINKPPTTGPRG